LVGRNSVESVSGLCGAHQGSRRPVARPNVITRIVVNKKLIASQTRDLLTFYMKEISAYPLLTRAEEIKLGHLALKGDENARHRLVEGNLRFVVKMARKYYSSRLTMPDLINEGNLGLIEAAKRYDPSRGVRFLTYAVWWIRQSILQAISVGGYHLRFPTKISSNLYRLNSVLSKRQEVAEPSLEELTELSGLSEDEIHVAMLLKQEAISLQQPLYADGNQTLGEMLPDRSQARFETKLMHDDLKRDMKKSVHQLTSREQKVLNWRFGLDGDDPRTLKQIGDRVGLSRERVRQIEASAIVKLRKDGATRKIALTYP